MILHVGFSPLISIISVIYCWHNLLNNWNHLLCIVYTFYYSHIFLLIFLSHFVSCPMNEMNFKWFTNLILWAVLYVYRFGFGKIISLNIHFLRSWVDFQQHAFNYTFREVVDMRMQIRDLKFDSEINFEIQRLKFKSRD